MLYCSYSRSGSKDELVSRSSSWLGRGISLEVKAAGYVTGDTAFEDTNKSDSFNEGCSQPPWSLGYRILFSWMIQVWMTLVMNKWVMTSEGQGRNGLWGSQVISSFKISYKCINWFYEWPHLTKTITACQYCV